MIVPRIQGMLILVNTLLLPLVLLAVAWLVAAYGERVQSGWQETRGSLDSIAARAEGSAQRVVDVAVRSEAQVRAAMDKLESVGRTLSEAGAKASRPLNAIARLSVPTVSISMSDLYARPPKPWPSFKIGPFKPEVRYDSFSFGEKIAAPFRTVFDTLGELAEPLDDLKGAVQELEKLKALQPEFARFEAEVAAVSRNALEFLTEILLLLSWLAYALMALMAWLALCYVVWAAGRLKRGTALLVYGRHAA
jgi:hypothetical protein